jgi:DNA polymerase III delta prime subunit
MFLKLESACGHLFAGPTQSGKTSTIFRIIKEKEELFKEPPQKIIYAYGAWQPAFEDLKNEVEFYEGLPTKEDIYGWTPDVASHTLLILDDVIHQATESWDIMTLFTVHCHHRKISVFLVSQNVFCPGKCSRTVSLNCLYLWLFKNKRDRHQLKILGSQLLPGEADYFMKSYDDATAVAYNYLHVNLHPSTPREFLLQSHVLPGEVAWLYTPHKKEEVPKLWSVEFEPSDV